MSELLPPNATPYERAVSATVDRQVPVIVREVWSPAQCPEAVLPWLAWALHVENWDEAITVAQKRSAISQSLALHQKKGTPWAVKQALVRIGMERVLIAERPAGAHWAEFDVDVTVTDRPLAEPIFPQITNLIDRYKPARSHLRHLVVALASRGPVYHVGALLCGETISIYPQQP